MKSDEDRARNPSATADDIHAAPPSLAAWEHCASLENNPLAEAVYWRASTGVVPYYVWIRLSDNQRETIGSMTQRKALSITQTKTPEAMSRDRPTFDAYPETIASPRIDTAIPFTAKGSEKR